MRSILGYGKMPLGIPSHVLQDLYRYAGGRLHDRFRVTSTAPPVFFLCLEYDICRGLDMRMRNSNNAPVISPIERMYDIRDASGVGTDKRPTVSSRVGQRVVWQVVLGLADEAWRARLPLASKLQLRCCMHARSWGKKPAVSGSSGKIIWCCLRSRVQGVSGRRSAYQGSKVQGRSDWTWRRSMCCCAS